MKGPLAILSYVGLGLVVLLALFGVGSLGVLATAQAGVGPSREILRVAAGTSATGTPAAVHADEAKAPEKVEPPASGIMYTTTEKVINLADRSGMRYLKVQVALELAPVGEKMGTLNAEAYKKKQDEVKKELSGKSAVIEDQVTTILSGRTGTELVTPDGKSTAKEDLKEAITETVAEKYQLLNVYFTQFIIQ
jgi:flagellar basal body-associated protein FliL